MVIVNTVVIVRGLFDRSDNDVALALASFGGGSMLAALILPRLLDRWPDRSVMVPAAASLSFTLVAFAAFMMTISTSGKSGVDAARGEIWLALLITWTLLGVAYSAVQTPTGRLLRRSAQSQDRPAIFAAQFALSHACWLVTYPLAGWLGSVAGMPATLMVLGAISALGAVSAYTLWPAVDPEAIPHDHPELSSIHPHVIAGRRHEHAFMIDDLHQRWPVADR